MSIINLLTHPEKVSSDGKTNPIVLDQKHLTATVGIIAVAMPLILLIGSLLGPYCIQSSISHYYFIPFMGSIFVGMLGFIGLFMLAYQGHTKWDFWLAKLGGVSALLVAVFPTAEDGCAKTDYTARAFLLRGATDEPTFDISVMLFGFEVSSAAIHAGSAGCLFLILGWFAFWSFRRDNGEGVSADSELPEIRVKSPQKKRRNAWYLVCGIVIFACVAALAFIESHATGHPGPLPPYFTVEAVALFAFGISWAIKGRLIPYFNDPNAGLAEARAQRAA